MLSQEYTLSYEEKKKHHYSVEGTSFAENKIFMHLENPTNFSLLSAQHPSVKADNN